MTYLAVEGGATQTRAALFDASGRVLSAEVAGPSNPTAYGMDACTATLTALARAVLGGTCPADAIYVAMAGAESKAQRHTLAVRLVRSLGVAEVRVATDLQPMLFANAGNGAAALVIAGTGSNILVQDAGGLQRQFGGRGSLLGDPGSGYWIGVRALRAATDAFEGAGPATSLTEALPHVLGFEAFLDLVPWSGDATKADIAALAEMVVGEAEGGDSVARACVVEEAQALGVRTGQAMHATGLAQGAPIFVQGSLLTACPPYRDALASAVRQQGPWALLELRVSGPEAVFRMRDLAADTDWIAVAGPETIEPAGEPRPPHAAHIDELPLPEIVATMAAANQDALDAVAKASDAIAKALALCASKWDQGGRLIFVGAGTSGRLGVLEAVECPPTFDTPAERIVGLLAGGPEAIFRSIEGAEDDADAGARDVAGLVVAPHDVVIGIAASGTTPYTLGALSEAVRAGAGTVLISSNPTVSANVDLHIAVETGREVVDGSTRLKAGTAQKLVLNTLTTGTLVLHGRVYLGRMIAVQTTNQKLRKRAATLLAVLTGMPNDEAVAALDAAGGRPDVALVAYRCGIPADSARARLDVARGNVREALGEA